MRWLAPSVRLSLAGVLTLCCVDAQATETRVRNLQGVAGIQDEVDTYTYPGLLPNYRVALVELGTAGNTDVYGAALVGKAQLSGGLAVSRSDWLFTSQQAGTDLSLFDRYQQAVTSTENNGPLLPAPEKPIDLLGAFRLSRESAIGVRLSGASYKSTESAGEGATERETRRLAEQVDLTVGYSGMIGRGGIDASLTTYVLARQKRVEKALGVTSGTHVKGKTSPQLSVRWIGDKEASAPYASAQYMSRSYNVSTETAVDDESSQFKENAIVIEGGYAFIQKSPTNVRMFVGADLAQTKSSGPAVTGTGANATPSYLTSEEKASIKGNMINAALSGEADITSGLGAMMGLHYALYGSIKEEDDTANLNRKTEVSVDETPDAALWSLGLYYVIDALRVDASYSKAFLHNGPFLVAGNATAPLFGRLSASYSF